MKCTLIVKQKKQLKLLVAFKIYKIIVDYILINTFLLINPDSVCTLII